MFYNVRVMNIINIKNIGGVKNANIMSYKKDGRLWRYL